eukprot:443770-Pelagomonas_calceolata.AAC.1
MLFDCKGTCDIVQEPNNLLKYEHAARICSHYASRKTFWSCYIYYKRLVYSPRMWLNGCCKYSHPALKFYSWFRVYNGGLQPETLADGS